MDKKRLETNIEYRLDMLQNGGGSVLFYGTPEDTLAVLREIYERAKKNEEFLCSWHDASKINQAMDFFEPILQLKYGVEYNSFKKGYSFKYLASRKDMDGVFQLASFCGQEKDSKNPNARRLPIFFIDGIEELLFKIDYGHLTWADKLKLLDKNPYERPLSKGFGKCLRGHLHQTTKGIFYGTVKTEEGIQYMATLGNVHYQFYAGNFAISILKDF